MTERNLLEFVSRKGAGIKDSVGDYHWVRVLDSFEMYVHCQDKSVSPHLAQDGFWESWITTWFVNNIRSGVVFWDIGANTGYYSMLAYYLGAMVSAFEPNPVYFNMLNATLDRHGDKISRGMFKTYPYALSDYNGEANLNIPLELHGSASINEIPSGYEYNTVTVPVRSFDELFSTPGAGIQVFKIDAEGEEERVLYGAKRWLSKTPHKVIMMEYTPEAYGKNFERDLLNNWHVSWINYDGQAEPVDREFLEQLSDWTMLLLYPGRNSDIIK